MSVALALGLVWALGEPTATPRPTDAPPPAPEAERVVLDSPQDTREPAGPEVEVLVPVRLDHPVSVTVLPSGAGPAPSGPRPVAPSVSPTVPEADPITPDRSVPTGSRGDAATPSTSASTTSAPSPTPSNSATTHGAPIPTAQPGPPEHAPSSRADEPVPRPTTPPPTTDPPRGPLPTRTEVPLGGSPTQSHRSPSLIEPPATPPPTPTVTEPVITRVPTPATPADLSPSPTTATTTPGVPLPSSTSDPASPPPPVPPRTAPPSARTSPPGSSTASPTPTLPGESTRPRRPLPADEPTVVGAVIDRQPPVEKPGSAPTTFPERTRSAMPQWASGASVTPGRLREGPTGLTPARDVVEVTLPGARWEELTGSNATFSLVGGRRGQTVWSVPLDVQRTPLEEIAAGRHDIHWAEFGRQVAAPGRTVVVRLVVPDRADPQVAARAFRQAALALRRSEGVLVEWGARAGVAPDRATSGWPGDDVVDLIGVETAADRSWAAEVAGTGGLADWRSWAASKGKRLAVHWDLDARSRPHRVGQMAAWLDVAAQGSTLAYDTVRADETADARSLSLYRRLWARR